MAKTGQPNSSFHWTLSLVPAWPGAAGQDGSAAPGAARETFTLGAGRHRVGADRSNEIHLDVRGVSRFHAAIVCHPNHCELEDLQSKNGSTVNGRPVARERLASGDELGFASVRAILQLVAAGDDELAFELSAIPSAPGTTRRGTVASETGGEPEPLDWASSGAQIERISATKRECLVMISTSVNDPPCGETNRRRSYVREKTR